MHKRGLHLGLILWVLSSAACINYTVNGTLPSILAAADYNNNRVLIWTPMPTTSNAPAQVVLGQPDFASSAPNNGGVSASSLRNPNGVCGDGKALFVADETNARVLVWNTVPTSNFQPANFVLGRKNSTSLTACTASAAQMTQPADCYVVNNQLFVEDYAHNHILIFQLPITQNCQSAILVIGQSNFSNNGTNCTPSIGHNLNGPSTDGRHFAVADVNNNRVLLWNNIPTVNGQNADIVLGQADFFSSGVNAGAGSPGPNTLSGPGSTFIYAGRLYVGDVANNRLLIWNSWPTQNQQPADLVIGAPNFTGGACTVSSTCAIPTNVVTDGRRLFASDTFLHRILIYNSLPTTSGVPADLVLGQSDFTTHLANEGGSVTSQGLFNPGQIYTNGFISGVQVPWGY